MSTPSLKRIVTAIQKLYPTSLADKTWDNTGLLLDCPFPTSSTSSSSPTKILLTIDLTSSVADEAIEQKASLILAYHPFIFRPLKSISLTNSQQNSLIRLTQSGISVYCPHTAIDAAIGGVNDWLADGISGGLKFESSRNILESVPGIENIKGHENGGMGRIINLKEPVDFDVLLNRVKTLLGMKNIQAAISKKHSTGTPISTIAICAGSGGSLFRGVKADLFFTGEIGHHEALSMVEGGQSAIICGHSNTERGFLKILQKQLKEVLDDSDIVVLSQSDKDPLQIV